MEFQDLLTHRHSTRSFSSKEVSLDLIKIIVKEAQTTASWVNSQPWKVYVAVGESLKKIRQEHLDLLAQEKETNPIFTVLSRDKWQPDQRENMAAWSEQMQAYQLVNTDEFLQLNRQLFKAPAILYFALPKSSPQWSILDMGAFIQTATLSANNLGLGTMVAYELGKFPDHLAKSLSVDENYEVVVGMALGYEDDHPVNQFKTKRRHLDDILTILD